MQSIQNTRAIFKRELRSYFESPVAYVFMIAFLVLVGFLTFAVTKFYERQVADLQPFFVWHPWVYLLLIPLILFYFLKLKRPNQVIPSLVLWRQVLRDRRVNSPFQRFKRNILLILQILLLVLLVLSAMQPYWFGGARRAARFVAPFLVVPFLLYPIAAAAGWLPGGVAAWAGLGLLLAIPGAWAGALLVKDPSPPASGKPHPAWGLMYLQLAAAPLGAAALLAGLVSG